MKIGTETGRLAGSGAAIALLFAIAILSGPATAFAIANQTVLCQGTITTSTDPATVPTGPTYSVGNVVINTKTTNANCANTVTTVTQVTQGTCSGQTPCVTTLTETNSVPLTTKGCGPGMQTPGITTSNITASSNPDLVGCSVTAVADTFSSQAGSFTMTLTPDTGSACKAAGTGGFTICTSNSQ